MWHYRSAFVALLAYGALLVVCFQLGILAGLGRTESLHDPSSSFLYIRRLLLIGAALFLPWLTGSKGLSSYGWNISPRWLATAVVLGILIGLGNKGGFDPRHPSSILLACFHAGATELFFRAYLITTFSRVFKSFWPPVIISSLMYGMFYMTVWTAWHQPMRSRIVFICLFFLIGLIHGYCYKKSGSFFVPWVMHFLGVLRYRLLI